MKLFYSNAFDDELEKEASCISIQAFSIRTVQAIETSIKVFICMIGNWQLAIADWRLVIFDFLKAAVRCLIIGENS